MESTYTDLLYRNAKEGFKPIHKLFLNGSGRVITPFLHDNLKSWLEDSPKQFTQTVIDFNVLEDITRGLQISPNYKGEIKGGMHSIAHEEHHIDEDSSGSCPFTVFGKAESNGTLSVRAYFDDENGTINRTAFATVTNYEVEWLECKCDSATGDQTN